MGFCANEIVTPMQLLLVMAWRMGRILHGKVAGVGVVCNRAMFLCRRFVVRELVILRERCMLNEYKIVALSMVFVAF